MAVITPSDLESIWLRRLIEKLGVSEEPRILDCKPDQGAQINECFPNVEAKVSTTGGAIVYGWQVWETEHLIEAEFHAVWASPSGGMLDVTPKAFPCKSIAFVPDPNTNYVGQQIDNVRINTSGNALVDDLIKVCEAKFKLENAGEKADMYALSLNDDEASYWQFLGQMRENIMILLSKGSTRNQQCFCGADKYKKCHGRVLVQLLERL
ncbi:SEC-C domain-containing protein [Vibrio crassostreae]|uniref:Sec-C metal-binding protein n=2 Tax=Vibrio crassostreae TaxID=246167 RepID=A0A1J0AJN8_9VIBR|nr:SEC-C domain-containing protein [Vibrio crassostreae]APB61951.1 Sec-C metal-binding protein [Vibrio crassostreae]TCT45850.1 hypothetical protein EDB42_1256 [Vibrio crassostreae]TCT69956.1 hypothetical protein EDB41_12552 [Vibrio crassostreae]TCT90069.1 hypothetical protein EDB38_12352 [Vibrio crassostreae]CAK2015221.1 Sec-C metal-binding protein [Vibrio crassostreae]